MSPKQNKQVPSTSEEKTAEMVDPNLQKLKKLSLSSTVYMKKKIVIGDKST